MSRNVDLRLESGDELDVRHFNVLQSMSAAFRIDIVARAADDAIHLTKIVGRPASFRLHSDQGTQTWSGVVAEIAQTHVESAGLSTYALKLVPTLWLLTKRRGHRIFQHASVPTIVQKILAEWKIEPVVKLTHSYPKLPMRTQYDETDYDFLRRLLAEAGISFFFHAEDGKQTKLVLSDAPHVGESKHDVPFHGDASLLGALAHVTNLLVSTKVVAKKAVVRDYDFRRPRHGLEASHQADGDSHPMLEDYRFVPGHSLSETSDSGDPMGDKEGAYRHRDDASSSHAKRASAAHESAATKIEFGTSLRDLEPGTIFTVGGHPHPEVAPGRKLLVTHSWINGDVGSAWHTGGHAVPADKPYVPSATHASNHGAPSRGSDDPFEPLAAIVKPRIWGVQSAVVTGPPGEDIHTDEHGRVKLQFPWDREGQHDEKSSPWVRVSQPSAGAGFGTMNLPRVGQEVLVGYQDGDPDHPVVTGRMFNTTSPVPYALPEHKTRTSIKSNSASGANEITLDDSHQSELFYVQAQKDLHKIVHNDELEYTQGSRHVHVDGDLILSAKGSVIIQAGGDLVLQGGPNVKINPGEKPKAPTRPKALSQRSASPAKTSSPGANERLKNMNPGSRPQSQHAAALNKHLAKKFQEAAVKLGQKYHIPPALILALMNRESGFGTLLDAHGRGDNGHGYGLLQIDDGTIAHPKGGPLSFEHTDQALGLFSQKLAEVKSAHPGWSDGQQLVGAVSAYNQGAGHILTQPASPASWAKMDSTSTGHDYSMDVWSQSQWYADHLDW